MCLAHSLEWHCIYTKLVEPAEQQAKEFSDFSFLDSFRQRSNKSEREWERKRAKFLSHSPSLSRLKIAFYAMPMMEEGKMSFNVSLRDVVADKEK